MDFKTTSTTQALRRALYLRAQDFNIWRPLTLQGFNFNGVFVQHHMDVVCGGELYLQKDKYNGL